MKKFALIFLSAMIFAVASCKDEPENDPQVPVPVDNSGPTTETERATEAAKDSTDKTTISVGKEGASVKTKKGTGVSVDKKGVNVESKKVKVDIKRDTTP